MVDACELRILLFLAIREFGSYSNIGVFLNFYSDKPIIPLTLTVEIRGE